MTLGMVFGLTSDGYNLRDHLPIAKLEGAGIPPGTWTPAGSTVFMVRKAA